MASATAPGRRAAAFFDLDGTLVSDGPIRRLLGLLSAELPAASRALWLAARLPRALQWRLLARLNRDRFRRVLTAEYAGRDAERLRQNANRAYPRLLGRRILPAARERVAWHRRQGHEPVLVTDELDFLVAPLARELDIRSVLAARLHEHAGRLSGQLREEPISGAEKARRVREWAQQEGVDLGRCWAYGVCSADLPLLLAVAHPVVVGPDPGLARVAQDRGWERVSWRRR